MARRRKYSEEPDNHERWLVSYADFITLLFAFFVVMYSLSSINEGKYRILSDSIVQAFRKDSLNDSGHQVIVAPVELAPIVRPAPPAKADLAEASSSRRRQTAAQMRSMAEELRQVMGTLSERGEVKVSEGAFGISIEINAALLFAPGEAALGIEAASVLRAVAGVLAESALPITVEGHTDNTPIGTYRFPSNWELSAVRASTVARLFIGSGVLGERITVAGYADQRPVADNSSEVGRARNRRVTILLEARDDEVEAEPMGPTRMSPDDPIHSILPVEQEGEPELPAPFSPPDGNDR